MHVPILELHIKWNFSKFLKSGGNSARKMLGTQKIISVRVIRLVGPHVVR